MVQASALPGGRSMRTIISSVCIFTSSVFPTHVSSITVARYVLSSHTETYVSTPVLRSPRVDLICIQVKGKIALTLEWTQPGYMGSTDSIPRSITFQQQLVMSWYHR